MKKDITEEYLKRIRENRNPSIPKEDIFNSMTTTRKPYSFFWRPNNYRRQMRVGIKTNSAEKSIVALFPHSQNKHTKLISITNYKENITIQYGKDKLTAIWKQRIISGKKQTWFIEADTQNELNEILDNIKQKIQNNIDDALIEFARKFKLLLPFEKPEWSRYEDWIKGEEYIDNLPIQCIIHAKHFKKVYGVGVEAVGGKGEEPTAKAKQYITNRMIEDFSPEIAESINNIVKTFEDSALLPLTEQIKLHLEVQRETLKTLKAIQNEKRSLSKEWGW